MSVYKFKHNDIFYNRIKTYPKFGYYIYNGVSYINNVVASSGSITDTPIGLKSGFISLYEMNVDRVEDKESGRVIFGATPYDIKDRGVIYPFIMKDSTLSAFKTVSAGSFATFGYGTVMSASYPMTASLRREYYQLGESRPRMTALKNTMNYYTPLSDHYAYDSSLGNKATGALCLVSIPSILYGAAIKKGSVSLKYYLSGNLLAEVQDVGRNGELVQVTGSIYAQSTGQNKVAGIVLYNEGFIILTGSWHLEEKVASYGGGATGRDYLTNGDPEPSQWRHWGHTIEGDQQSLKTGDDASTEYISFGLDYKGTNYVPVMTMLAHAPKGELNYSNNPTFVKHGQQKKMTPLTGSNIYQEQDTIVAKNTMTSSYVDPTGSYQKQTFISRIGLYDDDNNLIGVATLANPVKKHEDLDYTFKLKLDF